MNEVRPIARLYVAGLFGAAFAIAALALHVALPLAAADLPLALVLWLCMTLAWLFPIRLTRQTNLYADTGVTVAAVLLLPPGPAMLAIGAGPLAAAAIRRQPLAEIEAPFNAAQSMLVAFVGSLVLTAAGWNPGAPAGSQPWRLLALPAAAVAMHLLSVFFVATGVALQAEAPLGAMFRAALVDDFRGEALTQASLVAIGAVSALMIAAYPWALVLLAIPVVAIYSVLRRQVDLRQEAEQARLSSDAGLAEAQRLAGLGSWEWNPIADRQTWSDEARRILGFADRPVAASIDAFREAIHPADRDAIDRALRELQRGGGAIQSDCRVLWPDGSERRVHVRAEGRTERIMGTIQDVTERHALEAQVAASAERERTATELAERRRRLAQAREDERLRLARMLHDGPVQELLALSYRLADPVRESDRGPANGRAPDGLCDLRHDVLGVVGELRDLIGELRPAGLIEFGLPTALEGLVAGLPAPNGGKRPAITLDLDPAAAALPPALALTLFRVAQEAMRNALRHAQARHIRIELRCDAAEVMLRVADDGIGFAAPTRLGAYAEAGHFGLVGMAERIDHAGGVLAISSSVDGTVIDVRAPLPAGSRCDG